MWPRRPTAQHASHRAGRKLASATAHVRRAALRDGSARSLHPMSAVACSLTVQCSPLRHPRALAGSPHAVPARPRWPPARCVLCPVPTPNSHSPRFHTAPRAGRARTQSCPRGTAPGHQQVLRLRLAVLRQVRVHARAAVDGKLSGEHGAIVIGINEEEEEGVAQVVDGEPQQHVVHIQQVQQ